MKKTFLTLLAVIMLVSCCMPVFASAAESDNTNVVDDKSPLYKKSVLFVGDSICEASCEWGKELVGWPGRIMAWNDMTGINKGKSGASISTCRETNTVLAQLTAQRKVDYDFVIIHGGVNDAWDSAPVGVITEGLDAALDLTTFAGGLEATFRYAKKNYENAYIGYIINFAINRNDIGRLSDMSEYFDIAKQICDKWEIPYIDLYTDEDFNNNQLKYKSTENLPDYIHPNTSGFDIIAPVINDWMETLPATYAEMNAPESSEAILEPESNENSSKDIVNESENGSYDIIIYIICGVVIVAAIAVAVLVLKKKK